MASFAQPGPIPVPGAQQPQPGQFSSASLYVGDLHPDVTEALLFDIFNAVGPVASIRVCRDAVTRRSLGYAYVNFHNQQDADRALDQMNFTPIKGRPCRMMWSQRDPSLRKTGAGNVFVKNLDLSIDNKALYDTFSLFGKILSCKVVTDRGGASRGYGFVHFETPEAAEEAIRKINGMLIAGKEVFVGHFQRRAERPGATEWTNCYVKNIPRSWDDDKLNEEFSKAGDITSQKVMTDENGKSRGFGFVNFTEHAGAVKCVEMFNGLEFELESDEDAVESDGDAFQDAAIAKDAEDAEVEAAADAAEKKGDAADSDEKETADKTEDGKEAAGEGDDAAAAANAAPKKKVLKLVVCRAQKKTERDDLLAKEWAAKRMERINKYQGVNLYVKNLDENVTDDMLRTEFAAFGTITSARVMRDSTTNKDGKKELTGSKGFGFVCYSSPEEATKAVTEMNNKMILSKPIYVALAQTKEQRRRQLEGQHAAGAPRGGMARGMPMGAPAMYPGAHPMAYFNPQQPGMGMGGQQPGRGGYFMPPQMMPRQMPQMAGGRMPRGQYPMHPGFMGQPGAPMVANGQPGRGPNGQRRRNGPNGQQPQQQQQGVGAPAGGNYAARARMPQMQQQQQQMQMQMQMQQQQQMAAQQMPPTPEPLTAAALATATDEQQKNMIGERLYPLIQQTQPDLAGKITGMLLEMDNSELLHLLEAPDALSSKIQEAMQVLEAHHQQQQQQQAE